MPETVWGSSPPSRTAEWVTAHLSAASHLPAPARHRDVVKLDRGRLPLLAAVRAMGW